MALNVLLLQDFLRRKEDKRPYLQGKCAVTLDLILETNLGKDFGLDALGALVLQSATELDLLDNLIKTGHLFNVSDAWIDERLSDPGLNSEAKCEREFKRLCDTGGFDKELKYSVDCLESDEAKQLFVDYADAFPWRLRGFYDDLPLAFFEMEERPDWFIKRLATNDGINKHLFEILIPNRYSLDTLSPERIVDLFGKDFDNLVKLLWNSGNIHREWFIAHYDELPAKGDAEDLVEYLLPEGEFDHIDTSDLRGSWTNEELVYMAGKGWDLTDADPNWILKKFDPASQFKLLHHFGHLQKGPAANVDWILDNLIGASCYYALKHIGYLNDNSSLAAVQRLCFPSEKASEIRPGKQNCYPCFQKKINNTIEVVIQDVYLKESPEMLLRYVSQEWLTKTLEIERRRRLAKKN
jgi:hypothetical protein